MPSLVLEMGYVPVYVIKIYHRMFLDLASLDYYLNKLQWELTVKFIFKDIFATLMWGSAALITNSHKMAHIWSN